MKNSILLSALLIVCLSVGAGADERQAEPAAEEQPLVFLNSNSGAYGCAFNQAYTAYGRNLRAAGFRTNHGMLWGLTDEFLEGVDILILDSPAFALLDDDKAALRNFLRDGGGLLVMVYNVSVTVSAATIPISDLSNLESFLGDYGIRFGATKTGGFVADVPAGSPLSGPLPCSKIGATYSNMPLSGNEAVAPGIFLARKNLQIDPSNAEAAAVIGNGSTLAAISTSKNLGNGRLVVIGNNQLLENMFFHKFNNDAFGVNIMTYLAGGPDLRATLCKFKGRNISPGSIVKLTAKARNDGNETSEATIVRFVLCTTNTYDGSPPEVVATLGSVDLPALDPGKSKKVKVMVRIPATVTPGDYYVIAVADPNDTSGDINTSNNWKASKKQMTIN